MIDLVFLVGGLLGLILSGEMLVRGSVSIAQALRISPLVIGLTLVGFGTSAPELVTGIQAALAGAPGIAVGNVVGSNISNIMLILGLAAIFRAITVDPASLKRDGTVLVAATLLCTAVVLFGTVNRITGFAFAALLVTFLTATLIYERRRTTPAAGVYEGEADMLPQAGWGMAGSALLALGGLIVTILAARFLVTGAVNVASALGVSETIIGLTIVAVGTSMPELVTSVVAVRKGQGDVAFGNVIGSNLFNILGILGFTALVKPLAIPPEIARFDIWVMLAATLALVAFAITGWRIARREAAILLAAYVAYLTFLVVNA